MTATARTSSSAADPIRSYKDLIVWQKAVDLAIESYRLAHALPSQERFVLKEQVLRSAVSVPANIAEGHGRLSKGDYVKHLSVARGSLHELETLIHLAQRLRYFDGVVEAKALGLADEVSRMLWALIRKLGTRRLSGGT